MSEVCRTNLPSKTFKKPYKKSTNGCTSCKVRKVKCDETRPSCLQCQKRFADADCCNYEVKPLKAKRAQKNPTTTEMNIHIVAHPASLTSASLVELRLMHHFTKSTCNQTSATLSTPLPWTSIWELDIPQIAFTSDLVLNALFALSALDLSSRCPEDSAMAVASKTYFHKTVVNHRQLVERDDDTYAVPVLLTAVLIAHYTWLSAHLDTMPLSQTFYATKNTFHMCEGIIALTESKPSLIQYKYPRSAPKSYQSSPIKHGEFFQSAVDDLDMLFSEMDDLKNSNHAKTYTVVRNELIGIYHMIALDLTPFVLLEQKIVQFLHSVPRDFVDLAQSNDPPAMALWLRNIVLLELFEKSSTWWIQGSGLCRTGTRAAYSIRSLMPEEHLWTTDWPMKIVNREITLGGSP
ncbi:Zn2/Cys6 DNA-binding protein [Glarea lozoyensis ATCC 20868]|uniref:Zn2/Cys6 DNA-binding protein n=1 Tax=Glarea lozoyensis (strain ATCC 20868 / MF5171) TaxID=1116229 RepID=S3CI91_GLAL2|nr:Zn2/Cys6 DNA-binding protein [Glarea lozoyensis ATCC 20868]EPE24984.1 Zn2/Cys6 DNA-binding protein [Glarea lozoyensis ATCC 20868]